MLVSSCCMFARMASRKNPVDVGGGRKRKLVETTNSSQSSGGICDVKPNKSQKTVLGPSPKTNLQYWDEAVNHLTKKSGDEVMAELVRKYGSDGKAVLQANGNPFRTIVKAVVGQQISVKAADAVWKRLEAKLGGSVTPPEAAAAEVDELRQVGLSMRKAEYIKGIGKAWVADYGSIEWARLPEETARKKLQKLRGVGPWTVDMVMIFAIGMPDILPLGDIGMIRAIEKLYANGAKLKEPEITKIAQPWQPFRTVATWYLWRSIDSEPVQY